MGIRGICGVCQVSVHEESVYSPVECAYNSNDHVIKYVCNTSMYQQEITTEVHESVADSAIQFSCQVYIQEKSPCMSVQSYTNIDQVHGCPEVYTKESKEP